MYIRVPSYSAWLLGCVGHMAPGGSVRAQKEAGARRCQYFFFALEALRVKCAREAKEQMSKGEAQKCLHSKGVFAHKKGAHKDNHAPDRHRPALVLAPLSLCALRIRSDMLGLAMASIHRCPSPVLCPTLLLLHDGSEASSAVSSCPSIHNTRPIGLVSLSSATSATARRSPQEGAEPAFSQADTVFIRHPPRCRVSK